MERHKWLDNVRAIACLMVVVVHVTALTKYSIGQISNISWYTTVVIDSASRMCVPLFLMISGYIFLRKKDVKLNNVIKIFSALTFYSVLCVIYYSVFGGVDFIGMLKTIYQQPAMYHLWYLFYIFVYYVLFLFINARSVSPEFGVIITISAMVFFNPTLNDLSQFFLNFEIKNGFAIDSQYLLLFLYCFAGAFVGSLRDSRVIFKSSIVVCLTSIIIISYMTIIKSIEFGSLAYQYQNYITIPVFLSSISAFYIIKNIGFNTAIQNAMTFISKRSLAIYGVHAIFIEYMKFKKLYFFESPFVNLIVTYILVVICSCLVASVIKKVDKRGYVS
ncbi:MAG: acyltransferase family protein [Bacteroidales bacterium]